MKENKVYLLGSNTLKLRKEPNKNPYTHTENLTQCICELNLIVGTTECWSCFRENGICF